MAEPTRDEEGKPVIEQRPRNDDGSPGLWDTEEPGYVPRERAWHAALVRPGSSVVVRSEPVLAAGEDWTGYPPTLELDWTEWSRDHEAVYGLAVYGSPVAARAERKAAWRKLRRYAAGTDPDDEATRRAVAGAIRRILLDLAPEVTD
jgi:hypothetical protein